MKSSILYISFSIVLLTLGVSAQPKLTMPDGNRFDFGKIVLGGNATHTMTLVNTGSEILHISNVTVKCNCSTTRLSSNVIPVGDSVKLDITLNTDGLLGRVGRNLSIISNDPGQPVALVEFSAEVVSFFDVKPTLLQFTNKEASRMAEKTLIITNRDTIPVHILSAADPRFLLKTTFLQPKIRPQRAVQIFVAAHPIGVQPQHGVLEIRLDHPLQTTLKVSYIIEGKPKKQ